MVITTAKIGAVLENNKDSFDPALDDGQLQDIMGKIVQEIIAAPVIQEAKWITFTQTGQSESGKTFIYQVRTKDTPTVLLGEVRWFGAFRAYAFYPEPNTVYEQQCLNDITHFVETLMFLKKQTKK